MNEQIKVLDQGYIQLIETWGTDERIIESARMSTQKGFLGWGPFDHCDGSKGGVRHRETGMRNSSGDCEYCGSPVEAEPGDEKLLKFLWDNAHSTPFEMAGLTIEVKAPIFVFREWHRHRVPFGYNEMSARYIPLPDENYIPSVERILLANQGTTNKQAQGSGKTLTERDAEIFQEALRGSYELAEKAYRLGLALGVPKEIARCPVPVARYSIMRATSNLRGWLGFLKLRCNPAAQWEIRQFANEVAGFVQQAFPRTYEVSKSSVGMP